MRILQLDVNELDYELIEPELKVYEKSDERSVKVKNAVVMFVSIEKGDTAGAAQKAVDEAVAFAAKQKVPTLVLYPFAHLSDNLESPAKAMELFDGMARYADKSGLEVVRAPFGWNKAWNISIKGHPLAEQSRRYSASESDKAAAPAKKGEKDEVSEALTQEEKVVSIWYILMPEGKMVPVKEFNFKGHDTLKKLADYEITKVRSYQQVPAHIKLMQKLQLVDYEPGSDAGNMRFYPNGRLIKGLLERYVTNRVIDYGAIEVETPIMYDYAHPALKEYLNRFPARHYIVKSDDKEFFLRFSGDFGQFLLMRDATVSYKQLPFKFYEITRYSFRRELSGEVTGLKRLRAFTMPDMHTLCANVDQAKEEFNRQFDFCISVLGDIGIHKDSYEAAIRFTEGFWKENGGFVEKLAKRFGKPILVEMWNFRYAYFDPKFEFNVVDSMDKATALSTVQMDHENGKRYSMAYVDSDGNKKYPIVLHDSPSGAIERVIYALLEKAGIDEKEGRVPSLPLWLSPTQVRLLPISDKHVEKCVQISEAMIANGVRADVDDTNATLDKKVRNAEQEWVPYICVVGDKEAKSGKLAVRIRNTGGRKEMDAKELESEILKAVGEMPKAKMSLPMLLSKRPIFRG
jgi:threonyl-tRNA synthetase